MSKIEDLKRLAAQRTKGKWAVEKPRVAVEDAWLEYDKYPFIHTPGDNIPFFYDYEEAGVFRRDAEFIVACANNIENLLAVVEAAKLIREEMRLRPFSPDSSLFDILSEKLAALEEG